MNSRLILVAVLVLACASAAAVGAGRAAGSFRITELKMPLFVKQNGPRTARTIVWAGDPVFPVTVHERGICPDSVNCGPRTPDGFRKIVTTVFPTKVNPLVTPRQYFCSGNAGGSYVIGIEVWLTDAHDQKTPPARNFWVCRTH